MQEQATIAKRIQKLLALSQSNNVNESASALAKARELLLQYNLSMDDIDTDQPNKREYIRDAYNVGGKDVWRRFLANAIAQANFCDVVGIPKSNNVWFIGEKLNIESCQAMFVYIQQQLRQLASSYYKASGTTLPAATWKRSFYFGAIDTINQRLQDEKKQAANNVKALIVVRDKELAQATRQFFPHLQAGGRIRVNSGYGAGRKAGHQVSIRREVR